MSRGIYICANDRAIEQSIALLNSIKAYDLETPICLIPYDNNSEKISQILADLYGVIPYANSQFLERSFNKLFEIFGDNSFVRPHQFRKIAAWFGEFDEFLYIDTDIVVFEKIIDNLKLFEKYDFLCCDYQHKSGIKNVFTPVVLKENIFHENEIQDIFNGGFFASKKNLLIEQEIYDTWTECAKHINYFDFSQKTSDQPILNYLILKKIQRRFNLIRQSESEPGNWAGSSHFIQKDRILIDPKNNKPLKYLHWAGIRIQPGCPYWDIWQYYRYLKSPPLNESTSVENLESTWKQIFPKIKSLIKFKW